MLQGQLGQMVGRARDLPGRHLAQVLLSLSAPALPPAQASDPGVGSEQRPGNLSLGNQAVGSGPPNEAQLLEEGISS